MDEEVIQFYSVITMLMYVERMGVNKILEALEQFAVIFRRSISDCLNDYHNGEIKALQDMRNKEGCEAFRKLTDKFIICDRIGVRNAFDDLQTDREFYIEKQKQDAELALRKKVLLGQFISFVPLVLTIAGYLIIPFAKESVAMLSEFTKGMSL